MKTHMAFYFIFKNTYKCEHCGPLPTQWYVTATHQESLEDNFKVKIGSNSHPKWDMLGLYSVCLGKDIVFRFIIEYSSLRDFGPLGNNNRSIFIWGFLKVMIFWFVLKLEISYRIMIFWWILISFRGFFFLRLYFCMVKYLSFHNSSLA